MKLGWKDYYIIITLYIIGILAMFTLIDITIEKDGTVGVDNAISFIGAILGGTISGVITLLGVKLTIKSSTSQLNVTLQEQEKIRMEELKNNAIKEQLYNLYHPLNSRINSYMFKYGVHDFIDLSFEEQIDLMNLISENDIYAEKEFYTKILEIRWAYREHDYENMNMLYRDISVLLTKHILLMKNQLKLPNQEL